MKLDIYEYLFIIFKQITHHLASYRYLPSQTGRNNMAVSAFQTENVDNI